MPDPHLRIYLNDHLAASVSGIELTEHFLEKHAEGPLVPLLEQILGEIREDQALLKELIDRIGAAENPVKQAAAWVTEHVRRAKPGGDVFGESPLTRFEELETLSVGVIGRRSLWDALAAACAEDPRFADLDFGALATRAQRQHEQLEPHRLDAAREAFAPSEEERDETP